jgi:hypothetical protein
MRKQLAALFPPQSSCLPITPLGNQHLRNLIGQMAQTSPQQ